MLEPNLDVVYTFRTCLCIYIGSKSVGKRYNVCNRYFIRNFNVDIKAKYKYKYYVCIFASINPNNNLIITNTGGKLNLFKHNFINVVILHYRSLLIISQYFHC